MADGNASRVQFAGGTPALRCKPAVGQPRKPLAHWFSGISNPDINCDPDPDPEDFLFVLPQFTCLFLPLPLDPFAPLPLKWVREPS